MTQLRSLLLRGQSRLGLFRAMRWYAGAAACVAWGFAGLAVADRLFGLGAPIYTVLLVALCLCLAAGLVVGRRGRPKLTETALALDYRLGTDECFSTALAIGDTPGEFHDAVRARAEAASAEVALAKAVPVRFPARTWFAFAGLVLGLAAAETLGRLDLLGRERARREREEELREVRTQAVALERRGRRLLDETDPKALGEAARVVQEFQALSRDLVEKPHSRREALAKLSQMDDRLREMENRAFALNRMAWKARSTRDLAQTSGLAQALGREQYAEAAKAAEQLARNLGSGGEVKPAADQAKQLAAELERLANLAEGASPELAASLRQAAERLGRSDSPGAAESLAKAADQLGAMQQMAYAAQAVRLARQLADQARQGIGQGVALSQGCAKCGMPLNEFGNCPSCSGAYGASTLENATAGVGLSGLGGQALTGTASASGGAFGQRGQGRGGQAPRNDGGDQGWRDLRIQGQVHPGQVLASVKVKGVPLAGEAAARYAEVYAEYKRQAEESLARDPIPLGYREYIKDYFGELRPEERR